MATQMKIQPQPKQDRAKETVALVIEATAKTIRHSGEASVRVQDISKATGVSIGSIYHHFGDRDGLIRAAYVQDFASTVGRDILQVRIWANSLHSFEELEQQYSAMQKFLKKHFANQAALRRVAIVGNTSGRPELHQALAEVQNELTGNLAEVMKLLQARQMLKPTVHPRAAAAVILGMLFGRIIGDLDTQPVSDHEWNNAMITCFSGLFNSSGPESQVYRTNGQTSKVNG